MMNIVPDSMPSDETLAQQAQQGQTDSLRQLVERHHSSLVGYLYRMVNGDRPLAEDLAQESFLRMVRNLAQYEYPKRFKTWLYAIATNQVRDYYRRAEMRHTQSMPEKLILPQTGSLSPEAVTIQQDETRRALAALADLPDKQREAIVLFYYEEMSLAEVAEVLAIPVGTVKSRLSVGIGRLRQTIRSEG